MVDRGWFAGVKPDLVLVNTSRGDICEEESLIEFLEAHPRALYATDVLASETTEKFTSRLRAWAVERDQVLITPHIGGMTVEAQEIAYNHAARMLKEFLGSRVATS
jgi:D-3-phosphoglycerate dehydrogenase